MKSVPVEMIEAPEIIGDGEKLCILAICTLTSVHSKAYGTHLEWTYKLAKNNPNWRFALWTPYRMSIANFRNFASKTALATEAECVFMLDDDAVLLKHMDVFERLVARDKHIVMPVVYIRGYPFQPMMFKEVKGQEDVDKEKRLLEIYEDFKTDGKIQKDGLLEVAAVGCHATLIKTEVFKAIDEPYFLTGLFHTEDVYFCMKCREFIENIEIFVDTTFSIGHLLDPLYVDDENVEIMREFHEKLIPLDAAHYAEINPFVTRTPDERRETEK